MIEAMAQRSGISEATTRLATIPSLAGTLFETINPAGPTRWVNAIGRTPPLRGLQFCPKCLATDRDPYYRLTWRLAFATACIAHSTMLLDACPRCGSAASSHSDGDARHCRQCSLAFGDMAVRRADPVTIRFQQICAAALRNGWIATGPTTFHYSHLFFDMLHGLTRLLIQNGQADAIRSEVARRWGGNPEGYTAIGWRRKLETMPVGDRARLFGIIARLVEDWPTRADQVLANTRLWRGGVEAELAAASYALWRILR